MRNQSLFAITHVFQASFRANGASTLPVEAETGVYMPDAGARTPEPYEHGREPEEAEHVASVQAPPDGQKGLRIALKLIAAAVLILILILFSTGEVDFVYKGF